MQLEKVARATIRFPLEAPVAFWWTDRNGKRRDGEGSSRDLSERGAFVFATACPPVGARVELKIPLEGLRDTTEIELVGCVIRVELARNGKKANTGFTILRRFH